MGILVQSAGANLDGLVNDDDVTIIGATYAPGVLNRNCAMGDFDYNGFVDDDDVTLLGAFYQPGAALPAAAKDEVLRTRHGGQAADESGRGAAAVALTLPSPRHGESQANGGRGVLVAEAAAWETFGLGLVQGQAFDKLSSTLLAAGSPRETRAQQETRAQPASALTLPSAEGRGVRGNRDDEILVDLLAESFVAQAAGQDAGLGETGLPLRLAVSDVMALWWA
jgi:hypothetical protein